MILLQAMSVIFGLFMIYVVRIHFRRRNIEAFEYGAWVGLWIIFITVSIFPQTVSGISQKFNIYSVFDFLVICALMIISFLSFQNRISYRRLEKKLASMVRQNAIDDKNKKSKN